MLVPFILNIYGYCFLSSLNIYTFRPTYNACPAWFSLVQKLLSDKETKHKHLNNSEKRCNEVTVNNGISIVLAYRFYNDTSDG